MNSNDFTRVQYPKIEGIKGLIANTELVERDAIEWMNYFKLLHGEYNIDQILEAMPEDNGDCPRDCLKEIYKCITETLSMVNPEYETTAWDDLA